MEPLGAVVSVRVVSECPGCDGATAVVSVRVVSECPGCDGATGSRCISEGRIRVSGL